MDTTQVITISLKEAASVLVDKIGDTREPDTEVYANTEFERGMIAYLAALYNVDPYDVRWLVSENRRVANEDAENAEVAGVIAEAIRTYASKDAVKQANVAARWLRQDGLLDSEPS